MYEIFCGNYEIMKKYKKNGVKALNRKTMKFQIVDKDAKYEIIKKDEMYVLTCDKDLRKIAKEKDLILN